MICVEIIVRNNTYLNLTLIHKFVYKPSPLFKVTSSRQRITHQKPNDYAHTMIDRVKVKEHLDNH